jgi:hypothetical protein
MSGGRRARDAGGQAETSHKVHTDKKRRQYDLACRRLEPRWHIIKALGLGRLAVGMRRSRRLLLILL